MAKTNTTAKGEDGSEWRFRFRWSFKLEFTRGNSNDQSLLEETEQPSVEAIDDVKAPINGLPLGNEQDADIAENFATTPKLLPVSNTTPNSSKEISKLRKVQLDPSPDKLSVWQRKINMAQDERRNQDTSAVPGLKDIVKPFCGSAIVMERKDAIDFAIEHSRSHHPGELSLWTDGCLHQDGRAGASVVSRDPLSKEKSTENGWKTQAWRVEPPNNDSPDSVEIYAIVRALDIALDKVKDQQPGFINTVSVFTDCRPAIDACFVKRRPSLVPLLALAQQHAEAIESLGVALSIIWIPAHTGIEGNERADVAAKAAALPASVEPGRKGELYERISLPRMQVEKEENFEKKDKPGKKKKSGKKKEKTGMKNPDADYEPSFSVLDHPVRPAGYFVRSSKGMALKQRKDCGGKLSSNAEDKPPSTVEDELPLIVEDELPLILEEGKGREKALETQAMDVVAENLHENLSEKQTAPENDAGSKGIAEWEMAPMEFGCPDFAQQALSALSLLYDTS
ncbi:hypothetical protein G7046_g5299 [Stylonectria norvegica]|nr:hypothetical protein G7046_g5299 [Stylonectria norvegica]